MNELNVLDYALLAALLVIMPARSLWRSWAQQRTELTKASRYLRTLSVAIALLSVLAANWLFTGRSAASLGLSPPASLYEYGQLALAAVILGVLGTALLFQKPPDAGSMEAAAHELLPKTLPELRISVLAAFVLGFGWEVLFRGYLLFALEPAVGTAAAVAIAATSYAIGHGDKSVRQFVGSVAMAFAFTIAFAVTRNLWWLVLLHVGLPLLASAFSWKKISTTVS